MTEIHEKHWLVWAARERAPVAPNGIAPGPLANLVRTQDREPTVFDLYPIEPRDIDLADMIGLGVAALKGIDRRRHAAVRARYLAPSESVRQSELARRWDITAGRVSQLATEGCQWVTAWVEERWHG